MGYILPQVIIPYYNAIEPRCIPQALQAYYLRLVFFSVETRGTYRIEISLQAFSDLSHSVVPSHITSRIDVCLSAIVIFFTGGH